MPTKTETQSPAGQSPVLALAPCSAPMSFLWDTTGTERLDTCENIEAVRKAAKALWGILDDIDTGSDRFKPTDEAGYRRFYEYTMRFCVLRHEHLVSDGTDLFVPNHIISQPHENLRHP